MGDIAERPFFARFAAVSRWGFGEVAMRSFKELPVLAWLAAAFVLGSIVITDAQERLALKGYDPVAYFTDNRAMLGDAKFQHEFDGATYRFSSEKHLQLFKVDPDRYMPQYNNWCAASVAKGEKVHGNPEWWLVVDGRLYLFGKPNGPGLMRANIATMKSEADQNWSKVSKMPVPAVPDYMKGK
jgi:YHS domain-containing protein